MAGYVRGYGSECVPGSAMTERPGIPRDEFGGDSKDRLDDDERSRHDANRHLTDTARVPSKGESSIWKGWYPEPNRLDSQNKTRKELALFSGLSWGGPRYSQFLIPPYPPFPGFATRNVRAHGKGVSGTQDCFSIHRIESDLCESRRRSRSRSSLPVKAAQMGRFRVNRASRGKELASEHLFSSSCTESRMTSTPRGCRTRKECALHRASFCPHSKYNQARGGKHVMDDD